jgi:hypothetical protein
MEETQEQKRQKSDQLVELVMGVFLIAFAMIAVAVLLAIRVSDVLVHPY